MFYTKEDAKAFFALPLEERVKVCYIDNYCNQEQYESILADNDNNYKELLHRILEEDPATYYMYFNDYLKEDSVDYDRCYSAFLDSMGF